MEISRHNYETFFLLYIDGELNPAERLGVEAFLQQNPDLYGELLQLQSSVIVPGSDILFDKNLLFKSESFIHTDNCEYYFLRSVDGELTTQESEALQVFLSEHPAMQLQLDILNKTILQAETIVFEDKTALYRYDSKVKKIALYPLSRIAAAAAIIAIVATIWITNVGDVETKTVVALSHNQGNEPLLEKPTSTHQSNVYIATASVNQSKDIVAKQKPVESLQRPLIQKAAEELEILTSINKSNNLPKPERNPFLAKNRPLEDVENDIAKPLKNFENIVVTALVEDKLLSTAASTTNTIYKEVAVQEQETILIAGAEINKNKLKGLFKKATTLLEKRFKKNDGDNMIEIASFKINTN